MEKMKVALIGLRFNADKAVNTATINLPMYSKILSVTAKNDKPCLWVNFMAPSNYFFTKKAWREFQFVIVRCNYDEFEIDGHNYIATIEVDNNLFAIFYKKIQ